MRLGESGGEFFLFISFSSSLSRVHLSPLLSSPLLSFPSIGDSHPNLSASSVHGAQLNPVITYGIPPTR